MSGAFRLTAALAVVALGVLAAGAAWGKDYEVGPDKALKAIADVPWKTLQPGDNVLIYWRAEPYREKWTINVGGKEGAPVTVRGVANDKGQMPVIDGRDAKSVAGMPVSREDRAIIGVGVNAEPSYVVIENLEIRNSIAPYSFTGAAGKEIKWPFFTSAIWLSGGDHLTVRNCDLHDTMIALGSSCITRDVLIEGCYLHDTSAEGSRGTHSTYTAAGGIVYQYNRFGKLRGTSSGNALKDRSAGTVIRYNWIEYGNRQLDLVEAEDNEGYLTKDPRYADTFVYGNVLVEHGGEGDSAQIVHFGGDDGVYEYRKNLYFYNNTVVSTRPDGAVLFRLMLADETVDCRNNIFYAPSGTMAVQEGPGTVHLSHNWMTQGWTPGGEGKVNADKTNISGKAPGFVDEAGQDYRLAAGSPCIDAGGELAPKALPVNAVAMQYVKHLKGEARPSDGRLDIGAYEYVKVAAAATVASTASAVAAPAAAVR